MKNEAALLPKLLQVCDNKMEVVALGLVKGKAEQHCHTSMMSAVTV